MDQYIEYNKLDDSDSEDFEIEIDITEEKNGKINTYFYSIPYNSLTNNQKRLICYSILNKQDCLYGIKCTYAHKLEEQMIDEDKKFIFQIILDENLMNIQVINDTKKREIYRCLLFMTHLCQNCSDGKCTGGYNCRNGVNDQSLKLCKNDLLTGECINQIIDITPNQQIFDKLKDDNFSVCEKYVGCINGHHLTLRGLIPYYKYIHQQENSKKNKYQSIRYIDINPINRFFTDQYLKSETIINNGDSDSSIDEEVNEWFQNA